MPSVANFFSKLRILQGVEQKPMIKHILLLAAVLGFIAQSSVFAADPTAKPSPAANAAAAETPAKHQAKKTSHHKKSSAPKASPSPKAQG